MKLSNKCLYCKGRWPKVYCKTEVCPLYLKLKISSRVEKLNSEISSVSRIPFVSRFNYPNINVGVLAPINREEDWEYDTPRKWASKGYGISKIVSLRTGLLNSNIKLVNAERLLNRIQELSMSAKPVSFEMKLGDKPKLRFSFTPEVAPIGPSAKLNSLELVDNSRVPKVVDKVVSDQELKATSAINLLRKRGLDESYLTRLLSIGLLGRKKNRKLVPTRWSITAIDDTLSKQNIAKIKDFDYTSYLVFYGGYLGNYYIILLIPDNFSYELFEMMASSSQYVTDYESCNSRTQYADRTAGGYYAARLAITEKLIAMKRQAAVLAIRIITDEYSIPLGVWVVREAVRKALSNKPVEFSSLELMLEYAKLRARKSHSTEIAHILRKSIILDQQIHQTKLRTYI